MYGDRSEILKIVCLNPTFYEKYCFRIISTVVNKLWRKMVYKGVVRYSSSLLGFVFFLGLTSSGVKDTVPDSLETVERLWRGSSFPAGSASVMLIRELTTGLQHWRHNKDFFVHGQVDCRRRMFLHSFSVSFQFSEAVTNVYVQCSSPFVLWATFTKFIWYLSINQLSPKLLDFCLKLVSRQMPQNYLSFLDSESLVSNIRIIKNTLTGGRVMVVKTLSDSMYHE